MRPQEALTDEQLRRMIHDAWNWWSERKLTRSFHKQEKLAVADDLNYHSTNVRGDEQVC
jgi:hypothetical protein